MTILLRDIWPLDALSDYKVHFARWNGREQPLEVFVRDRDEWQEWQEYWPGRNDFNRPYIFSLVRFYHETDAWLFGGVYRVVGFCDGRYEVELSEIRSSFVGRLKLYSPHRGRVTRAKLESHYANFEVLELLKEPYSGRRFPGYEDIYLSFEELEVLAKNNRPDWKAALENVKGVYIISDVKTGRHYVGSAYGDQGIWSRWCGYVASGHGGNAELRALIDDPTLAYCRANFQFSLLEYRSHRTSDDVILDREAFWKRVLLTRGGYGLNRN